MQNKKGVMMIGGINALRMRIQNILIRQDLELMEVRNEMEAIPLLMSVREEVCLIIVDGDMIGLSSVQKISENARFIPILFMSSFMGRNHILEAISSGAHDYLLKPFDDGDFEDRVIKHLRAQPGDIVTEVFMDLRTYLSGEFRKAIKGNFAITCMFITIKTAKERNNKEMKAISTALYEHLRHLFWETDVFLGYGTKSFLGVFPFCTPENAALIEQKIKKQMGKVYEIHKDIDDVTLAFDFISYPEDVSQADEVLSALMNKPTE